MLPSPRRESVRGSARRPPGAFAGRAFDVFGAWRKILVTGDRLRVSYTLRRHSPFYSRCGGLSIAMVGRAARGRKNMNNMVDVFGATSTTDEVLYGVNLQGKRILVTGVSAGLGIETARSLAAHGAHVVGAARDLAKAEAATAEVRKAAAANGGGFELIELDLANLKSARTCADKLLAKKEPFDVVIANAGVMATPFGLT